MLLAAVVAVLVLAACSWMLPLVVAARGVKKMVSIQQIAVCKKRRNF